MSDGGYFRRRRVFQGNQASACEPSICAASHHRARIARVLRSISPEEDTMSDGGIGNGLSYCATIRISGDLDKKRT